MSILSSKSLEYLNECLGGKFNTYFLNNNRMTTSTRKYVLVVDGISESYEGNKGHDEWIGFLQHNPHVISNFDTEDSVKLNYLFRRWKIFHNNG